MIFVADGRTTPIRFQNVPDLWVVSSEDERLRLERTLAAIPRTDDEDATSSSES